MKKYFSIFAVVLMALVATSCELNDGTSPDPNKANKLLWKRVEYALYEQLDYVIPLTQLNDFMTGTTYAQTPYKPCNISQTEGAYTMDYGNGNIAYRIVTGNKLLEEGGEWSLYMRYGTYMSFQKCATVKGVVGESAKFSVEADCREWQRNTYYNRLKYGVEYGVNAVTDNFDIILSDIEGDSSEYPDNVQEYLISFKSNTPFFIENQVVVAGEADITYEDFKLNTKHSITVRLADQIATFLSHK